MSDPRDVPVEMAEWIARSLDGRCSTEEFAQLEQALATNEKALAYYLEFVTLSVGLIDCVGVLPRSLKGISETNSTDFLMDLVSTSPATEANPTPIQFQSEMSEEDKARLIEEYAQAQLEAFLLSEHQGQSPAVEVRQWDIVDAAQRAKESLVAVTRWGVRIAQTLAACALLLLVGIILYATLKGNPKVGMVQETVSARWAHPVEVGIELGPQELQLQEGYARIQMKKGAEVIIQAPATLELQTSNRLFLQSGLVTAIVPESAQGFTIDTPQSRIVDYGTEFGVLAGNQHHAEVHVFTGQVGLDSNSHDTHAQETLLKTGQAALIDREHHVTELAVANRPRLFTRQLSDRAGNAIPGKKLCLADIMGGGNGLGTGQSHLFVDPQAGYVEAIYGNGKGNEYHPLMANPFVDGLFIPNGQSQQIVSSQGHIFLDCPPTNGQSAANLGITPQTGAWQWKGNNRTGVVRFNGQTYGDPSLPFLMMHANLGVTFDLNHIRNLCPGVAITCFAAQTGIADFIEPAPCNADFWVIVDGQVRASQRNVTHKGVLSDLSVALSPEDRFLTLITTDGGDTDQCGNYQRSYTCDWCVFIQPTLVLEIQNQSQVSMK